MGLFSGSKKTYVASTPYNMAGPEAERLNFLKSTVSRAVLMGSSSIADDIVAGQREGPALDQLNFMRWAKKKYDKGRLSGSISGYRALGITELAKVEPILTVPAGKTPRIETAFVDDADIEHFARKYMLENHKELIETDWSSDFQYSSNQMKIIFESGAVEYVSVPDFDPEADYVYAFYNAVEPEALEPVVEGSLVTDLSTPPNLEEEYGDYRANDPTEMASTEVTLDTTVTIEDHDSTGLVNSNTFSDSHQSNVHTYHQTYTRTFNLGVENNRMTSEKRTLNVWKKYRVVSTSTTETELDIPETGTTRTTTKVEEKIQVYYESRFDTQKVTLENGADQRIEMYRIGDGNPDLDALVVQTDTLDEFFPIIPLRQDNVMIDEFEEDLPMVEEAYKKAIGTKLSEALESIKENPDVGDIDFAFLTFGVEINTEEMEGRRYIYEFFRRLMQNQDSNASHYIAWRNAGMPASYGAYLEWVEAQENPDDLLYGSEMSKDDFLTSFPSENRIDIRCADRLEGDTKIPFHYQIAWTGIDEKIDTGLGKPDAKVGDLWWEDKGYYDPLGDNPEYFTAERAALHMGRSLSQMPVTHVRLFWQENKSSYRFLDIYGARHINKVYKGKSVETQIVPIKGASLLRSEMKEDQGITDPETSGFVLPLHEETLKKLRVTDRNELAISNKIIIFNSYKVVKKKWWESGFWSIIFSIVIAVTVSIVFPGVGGLLGANLTVGTAAGFGGIAAIIAGAAANAVASILLTMVVQAGAAAIFDDDWGKLVAAIAMVVMGNMFSNMQATGNFAVNWSQLSRAESLLELTGAVSEGTRGFVDERIEGIGKDLEGLEETYREQMEEIEDLFSELGYSGAFINPIEVFAEEQDSSRIALESSATFLRRTLLTGSDISQLSLSMVDNFPDVSLALPEAIE